MRLRSTIILLVVAAAMVAFVYFFALDEKGTKQQLADGVYVTQFEVDDVRRLTIMQRSDKIVIERDDARWRMVEPVEDRAYKQLILQILTSLASLPHVDRILPDQGQDADDLRQQFGLAQPKMEVVLEGDGDMPHFLIGREAAVPGRIYIAMKGRPTIYVVEQGVREMVNQPADTYRDVNLTDLTTEEVARFTIENEFGIIELEKERSRWKIKRPVDARADSELVDSLLSLLLSARIHEFVDTTATPANELGFNDSSRRLGIHPHGSDAPYSVELGNRTSVVVTQPPSSVGEQPREEEIEGVYARYPARNSTYILPGEIGTLAELNPNDLRDRTVLDLNLDVVDRFQIERIDAPDLLLVRDKEDWLIKEPVEAKANRDMAMAFLQSLNTTSVSEFVSNTATELERYGLEDPWMRILISSYVSENIPHGGPGKSVLAEILVGDAYENGYYAMLAGDPFIFALPGGWVNGLPAVPAIWRSPEISTLDPEIGWRVRMTSGGRDTEVEHGEGRWFVDGDKVAEHTRLESFADAISPLKAIRWHASEPDAEPTLRLSINQPGRDMEIAFHGQNKNGMWVGKIVGTAGSFELSAPDYEALLLPFTYRE